MIKKQRKLLFLFLFIRSTFCLPQELFNFSVDTSVAGGNFWNLNCHFIGEYHYQKKNDEILIAYAKELNKRNIFPKYIVIERAASYAYVFNLYLNTGKQLYLDNLAIPSEQGQYKSIYLYRNSLPSEHKFEIVGVDYTSTFDFLYTALRDVLLSSLKDRDPEMFEKVNGCTSYEFTGDTLTDLLSSYGMVDNTDNWATKSIMKNLNTIRKIINRNSTKDLLGERYKETLDLLKDYDYIENLNTLQKDRNSNEREKFIATNIYNTYLKDTTAVLLIQYGSAHIPKKNVNWAAANSGCSVSCLLNENEECQKLNGKVSSSFLIYKTFNPRKFKYLKIKKDETKEIFNEMSKKGYKAYMKSYQDVSILDNLIYLDNSKH